MSQQSTYTPGVKEAALERLTGFLSMRQLGSCRIDGQKTTVRSNGSGRQRTRAYAHGTGCLMPEQGMSTRRPQRRMLHRARQILRDVPTAQRDAKTKLTSACSRRWSNKGRSVHPGGLALRRRSWRIGIATRCSAIASGEPEYAATTQSDTALTRSGRRIDGMPAQSAPTRPVTGSAAGRRPVMRQLPEPP